MPFRRRRLNISLAVNRLMRYVVLGLGISGRVHRASERCRLVNFLFMPKNYLIVLLRSIRLRKLKCGVEGRHRLNYRRQWGRSFRSTFFSDGEMPRDPIEQVILRRGSARKFAHIPIGLEQLSTMLDRTTRGIPADFLDTQGVGCTTCI